MRKVKLKLLPCPFCGALPDRVHIRKPSMDERFRHYSYVRCSRSRVGGCGTVSFGRRYMSQAIAAWNRRVGKGK